MENLNWGSSSYKPPIDPQIPSYDEIQHRFYSITDSLVENAIGDPNSKPGNVIAVGSSIIKLWDNIRNDLLPYKVVNHGFGGSRSWEMIYFVDKLVTQYQPKVVLIYCGSNDINAGEKAKPIISRIISFMNYLDTAIEDVQLIYISTFF